MEEAKDPLTGEKFIKKRNNQIFANRKNQIRFNNLKAQEKRKSTVQINSLLNKNRMILKQLLINKTEITKSHDFLLGAGFHFGVNTHTLNIDNKKWTCIYEYSYSFIGDNQFKIIINTI